MAEQRSTGPSQPQAAEADILGPAVPLPSPQGDEAGAAVPVAIAPTGASLLPEPPPAEDENQPGFIGERNRPAP